MRVKGREGLPLRHWLVPVLVVTVLLTAMPAHAQQGRLFGRVRDAETGDPIRGATVTAENPQGVPRSVTSISDDKGRFSLVGMRSGIWLLSAAAPGYEPVSGTARVQALAIHAPLEFKLVKAPAPTVSPFAGIDTAELQRELTAAEQLVDQGAYREAIVAYTAIVKNVPALTSVHLQIGHAYRLLKDFPGAIAAYQNVGPDDPYAELARVEIGLTELERGNADEADRVLTAAANQKGAGADALAALGEVKLARGDREAAITWLEKAIALDPDGAAAARARTLLEGARR